MNLNGGLYSGQLIVIGARHSVGKISFAVSLARNMIERNKRILFFSLEMSADDIIGRLIDCILIDHFELIGNVNFTSDKYERT